MYGNSFDYFILTLNIYHTNLPSNENPGGETFFLICAGCEK